MPWTIPNLLLHDKLPKAEHDLPEWQAATEALLMAAEDRGPLMHARIGVLRALNRNVERTLTDRKEMHWGKRKAEEGRMNRIGRRVLCGLYCDPGIWIGSFVES